MIKGEKKSKYNNRFKYYLRFCDRCGALFKARTKGTRFCDECKEEINREKIKKSLSARGIIIN